MQLFEEKDRGYLAQAGSGHGGGSNPEPFSCNHMSKKHKAVEKRVFSRQRQFE
jgi:hypothetical protein